MTAGDYGEGFVGVGYYHPSMASAPAVDTETSKSTRTNDSSVYYEDENENDSQVLFVAAQRCEGNVNSPSAEKQNPDDPQQEQEEEQQEQQEKEAEIARLKAMDIVRNILHGDGGDGSSSSYDDPLLSVANNRIKDNNACRNNNSNSNSNVNNHQVAYYGPRDGFSDNTTTHCQSNATDETASAHQPHTQVQPQSQHQSQSQHQHQPSSSSSIENDAQVARLKAMDILRKFQSQQGGVGVDGVDKYSEPSSAHSNNSNYYGRPEVPNVGNRSNDNTYPIQHQPTQSQSQSPIMTTTATVPTETVLPTTPPWELGRRRRECLDRDLERKKRALFKNLQHVARLEEERLLQQLDQVQQVKTLEQQIDERYHQRLESRTSSQNKRMKSNSNGSNDINTSGAGIGTKQRRRAEQKRKRTALPPSLRNNNNNNRKNRSGDENGDGSGGSGSGSVAIYVSNLPTDGSVDEDTIRALFGSYGSLRKVHFYVDKTTGRRKGDALVIYSLKEGGEGGQDDEASLIESVCSQVNGCELPGGTVLRVQPSDPYYKVTTNIPHYGFAASSHLEQHLSSTVATKEATREKGLVGDISKDTVQTTRKIEDRPPTTDTEKMTEQCGGGDDDDEEEDLDDFFASLE